MDAGERRHRAAGAEQADAVAGFGEHGDEIGKGAARPLAHALVGLDPVGPLERLAAFAFGQRDHAPWRAPPGVDPRPGIALVDQHQLGRAAADVEDQRRSVPGLEQFVAAEYREPRLFGRRDDVEHDPGFAANALGELPAVGGAAAGFGRDRARQ